MTDTIELNARKRDPKTSHDAAKSISDRALRATQKAVLAAFEQFGPLSDTELVQAYQRWYKTAGWPLQSDSGIRTRRKELVKRGVLALGGTVKLASGRSAQVHRVIAGRETAAA